jgi:hypothetical protein
MVKVTMTLESLKQRLTDVLCKEISFTPDRWDVEHPTRCHCAVVALIVQDYFGGDLLKASLVGTDFEFDGSHFWNRLPDGTEVDLTQEQFEGRKPILIGEVRNRNHVLSSKNTQQRYKLLTNLLI